MTKSKNGTAPSILSRDQIVGIKDDIKMELVEVPEWGGSLYVRGLTGFERDRFEAEVVDDRKDSKRMNLTNVRARLVALAVVDENGTRLFKPTDIEWLGQKSAAVLDRIYDVATRLSGISDTDIEGMVDDLKEASSEDSPSV